MQSRWDLRTGHGEFWSWFSMIFSCNSVASIFMWGGRKSDTMDFLY